MNQKVREVLTVILDRFKTGDIPEAIALASYPRINVPSNKWSLLNRTVMFLSGTYDARGFRQWKEVNRSVKKGSKAIYILVPSIRKSTDQETEEEILILKGFIGGPVFKVEDTDGEPLEYEELVLPDLPLLDRAEEWGIEVKAIPGNFRYYGYFSSQRKEIALATKAECVFFHELAHASHEKVKGKLKPGQDPVEEIIAELAATALCKLVGKDPKDNLGNSYQYIEKYATKAKLNPISACLTVMSETEKVINLILKGDEPCVREATIPQNPGGIDPGLVPAGQGIEKTDG